MLTRLLRLLAPLAPRRHPRSFPIPFRSHFSALSHLPFLPRPATPAPRPRPLQHRQSTPAQPQPHSPSRPKNPAQAISGRPAPSGGGPARDSSPFTPTQIRPLAPPACPATPRSARPPASPAASVFPLRSAASSLAPWERVGACPGRDPGVRVFRATRRNSAPSPQRTPQVLPKCPPPHLKSFLEETLIAREAPTSARLARRHQSPVPTPDATRPALTPLPSPLPSPPPSSDHDLK